MRIASIALKNFRIYQDAEITFDQSLAIIRGANHTGKSSIAHAIQLALSRRADGTDPRGAGANDKIRNGADKALIGLRIVGKSGAIDLKTTYGPNKTGRNQTISIPDSDNPKLAKDFDGYLEKNIERLACVLDTEFFTSPKTDQRAILASLVLPSTYEFDAANVAMAEKHLGTFAWDKSPVAVIDQVYAAAYSARKDAKAALGAIYIPQEPQTPAQDVATINAELADLRAKAAKEMRKRPTGGNQAARLEAALESTRARLQPATDELESAQRKLSEINGGLLENAALNKLVKVAAGRAIYNSLEDKIDETVREIQAQKDAQGIYEDLLESPFCPTCTQAITKEFIDGKIALHKGMENEAIEQQLRFMAEQKELGGINDAEGKIAANNALLSQKQKLHPELSTLSARVAQINQDIFTGEIALNEAKKSEPATVDTTELDALNEKISMLESDLRPAVQYETTLKQIDISTAQKKAAQEKVSDLELLCSYFGKDGIKATLIGQHIDTFTATVNRVLKVWGYQSSLSIEPYEFLVNSKNGVLPLKELSGSERLMFGAALQCAIAVHSKIKLVVIDRADTFINGERNRLFGCLQALLADQTLDQAIVLVSDDRAEAPKQQSGVAFYRVADGKVVRL